MPSWQEVRAHLIERFTIGIDGGDWLALSWEFPSPAGPVTQPQRIERGAIGDRALLAVLCPVASSERISAHDALAHNMSLATGALALSGATVVLRAVFDVEHLAFDRLDRGLEVTAHEAARLRHLISGGFAAESADAFDHWS